MRTYDNILTEVKASLRLTDTTDHDSMIRVLMNNAIQNMNLKDSLVVKNCIVPIQNGKAKLPEDFVSLIAVRFPDCSQVTYFEEPYINDCRDCANVMPAMRTGQIVGGWFCFNSSEPADATEVDFAYEAQSIDDDGFMIMKDEYANAVRWFTCMEMGNSFPKEYPERTVARWERFYIAAAGKLRGQQQVRHFKNNREYMKTIMNSILSDKRSVFQFSGLERRSTHYSSFNNVNN